MSDDNPPADHATVEERVSERAESGSESEFEKHVKSRSTWLRLLFMLIYYALISIASMVGTIVVVLGFLWVLFTGEVNRQLRQAGQGIAAYIYEIIRYLTFNTDDRPFPFGQDWPSGASQE